jgi:hypothetical protein
MVFGTKIFEAASEKLDEYTSTTSTIKQDAIKKGSFDAFASVILLRNSDQNKYGTLLDTMTTTLALGSNVFPKTKEKAIDALSKYSFDPGYVEYKQKNERPTRSDTSSGNQNSFAQKPKENLICHCCGKKGHAAPDCTLRACGRKFIVKTGTSGEPRIVPPGQIIMMRTKKKPRLDVEKRDGVVSNEKLGSVSTLAT